VPPVVVPLLVPVVVPVLVPLLVPVVVVPPLLVPVVVPPPQGPQMPWTLPGCTSQEVPGQQSALLVQAPQALMQAAMLQL
jgi:hypothetical protein